MKNNIILEYIKRESLKIKNDCEKRRGYIIENINQLEQQERLYKERLEEVTKELDEERKNLAIIKIQEYGANKVLEVDNSLISNVIKKYDKVTVIANLPDQGEAEEAREKYIGKEGVVVGIDEQYSFPYNIEFYNKDGELEGCDWLWKREELEFTKGEW